MSWRDQLNGDSLNWLLEPSAPGVRYLALRDLVYRPGKAELRSARTAAHKKGPIASILRHMEPEGYWVRAGPGYNPKYRSAVWSLISLAQLGARMSEDRRIRQACTYILDHGLAEGGQFSTLSSGTPSGTVDCLQGNLCWALLELGCDDKRLDTAFDWMARTVTGEGMAPPVKADAQWRRHAHLGPPRESAQTGSRRYFAYKSGPTFACGINGGLPCAWGGVKVMLAMAKLQKSRRTPVINRAIRHGLKFVFSIDPGTAMYPFGYGERPSRNWWKFGFPVMYVTDLLQLAEALVALGRGRDRRLKSTLRLIREKQDEEGRWPMEYDYLRGKMWVDFGRKNQPNKWVTLRALRVLKAAYA